jgi:hypothetical protein
MEAVLDSSGTPSDITAASMNNIHGRMGVLIPQSTTMSYMFHHKGRLNPKKTHNGHIHEFSLKGDVQQVHVGGLLAAVKLNIASKTQKKPMRTMVDRSDEIADARIDQLLRDMKYSITKDFLRDVVVVDLIETTRFNVTHERAVQLGLAQVPRMDS